jgi:peptidoglycan hydrolase FlgJ
MPIQAATNAPGSSSWYDFQSLASMKAQAAIKPKEATQGVAQQFESVFINMMLTEMRKTVGHSELMGSSASDTYQEMFDQQVSVSMAKAGGIGLAPYIEKQLNRYADAQVNNNPSGKNLTEISPSNPSKSTPALFQLTPATGEGNQGMTIPVTPTEHALKTRGYNNGE